MSFRLVTSHKAQIFQVTTDHLIVADAEACKNEILANKSTFSLVMLDLSKVKIVDSEALNTLAEIGRVFSKDKSGRIMVIGDELVIKAIRDKGLADVLPCYTGVVPVPSEENKSKTLSEMNPEFFFKVTLPAIKENLKIYAKMDADFGKPTVCLQKDRPMADIAGVGGFFCNNRKGSLMLCFKEESYVKIVSSIVKKKHLQLEPKISDWSAELVNSILGRVKSDLRTLGYTFNAGIPAVFVGKDLEVFYSKKLATKLDIVKCTGEFGEFYVELMLTDIEG